MAVNSFNAQNPPVTTKGDVFTFSTIPTRLGVGANNTVLTADSSTATGLKWAAPAASGGFTLISTATPSAATTISFTSIPTTYKVLYVVWDSIFQSVADQGFTVRLNNDTGSNYAYRVMGANSSGTFTATAQESSDTNFGNDSWTNPIPETTTSSTTRSQQANGYLIIYNADQTTDRKAIVWSSTGYSQGGNGTFSLANGIYFGTSAISRIDFIRTGTQTVTGTVRLYGAA